LCLCLFFKSYDGHNVSIILFEDIFLPIQMLSSMIGLVPELSDGHSNYLVSRNTNTICHSQI